MNLQQRIKKLYEQRGYTSDLPTLGLGLCEEAGEVAKAINVFHNPKYVITPGRHCDSVEHELRDVIVYVCGIANVLNIDLKLDENIPDSAN